jgi:hypothetical protein
MTVIDFLNDHFWSLWWLIVIVALSFTGRWTIGDD